MRFAYRLAALLTVLGLASPATAAIINDTTLTTPWSNGTGPVDGHFTVDRENNGVELGLRASLRLIGPITPAGNVYVAPLGASNGYALWNFDFSFDPGSRTNTRTFLSVRDNHGNSLDLPFPLDSIPDNTKAGTASQNSENIAFLGIDPNLPAIYTFTMTMFANEREKVGSVEIQVNVGAVPEPSTWAMLLLGFAGVGALAYRRRNLVAAV